MTVGWRGKASTADTSDVLLNTVARQFSVLELEMKVKRKFAKISQSRRSPPLGPTSVYWRYHIYDALLNEIGMLTQLP